MCSLSMIGVVEIQLDVFINFNTIEQKVCTKIYNIYKTGCILTINQSFYRF